MHADYTQTYTRLHAHTRVELFCATVTYFVYLKRPLHSHPTHPMTVILLLSHTTLLTTRVSLTHHFHPLPPPVDLQALELHPKPSIPPPPPPLSVVGPYRACADCLRQGADVSLPPWHGRARPTAPCLDKVEWANEIRVSAL